MNVPSRFTSELPARSLREFGVVALSAVLCGVTVYPCELWILAPVCWSPFVSLLRSASLLRGAALGLFHGVLLNGIAFFWLLPALSGIAAMPATVAAAVFLALIVWQGGRTAAMAMLFVTISRRGWPPYVAFPAALLSAELAYPMVFPWHSAIFATGAPSWIQLAAYGGPLLVSLWIAVANGTVVAAWDQRRTAKRALLLVACLTAGLLVLTLVGRSELASIDGAVQTAPSVRLGVVQGNFAPGTGEPIDPVGEYRSSSIELLGRSSPVDLLVWPETAVSYPVEVRQLPGFLQGSALRGVRSNPHDVESTPVPALFGVVLASDAAGPSPPAGDQRFFNSAVLADADGRVLGRYDKMRLVPVGEGFGGALLGESNRLSEQRFSPGSRTDPLRLDRYRLQVSICYEDILHGWFRDAVAATDPHLLVNLTSDAWFAGTPGPHLHQALAALRAVEHRRFFLRAATTGVTALFDPGGRVVWQLEEGKPDAGVVVARFLTGTTPFGRFGDWPWAALVALVLPSLVIFRRPRHD